MVVKTYRGRLAHGAQNQIRLQTIKGKVGYQIKAFRLFPPTGDSNIEATTKIYKNEQSTIDNTVDFTDSDLLAAAMFTDTTSANYPAEFYVIFDNETFNQNIFITNSDPTMTAIVNYYIELEVIPLDDAGAEYTTLKNMRQS